MEAGGRLLGKRGVGEQVAGKLLDGELVKRHVLVDGPDHPVAVSVRIGAGRVLLVAVAVGIAGQVQPVPSPAFAEVGRVEQAVDQPVVGFGIIVFDKGRDVFGTRKEAE